MRAFRVLRPTVNHTVDRTLLFVAAALGSLDVIFDSGFKTQTISGDGARGATVGWENKSSATLLSAFATTPGTFIPSIPVADLTISRARKVIALFSLGRYWASSATMLGLSVLTSARLAANGKRSRAGLSAHRPDSPASNRAVYSAVVLIARTDHTKLGTGRSRRNFLIAGKMAVWLGQRTAVTILRALGDGPLASLSANTTRMTTCGPTSPLAD